MAEPDYYQLIGVDRNATLHEIRSKFRAKVLAEHPDKGGDPKKFQLLNKAYNVLTDTEKRRRYDTTGRAEKSAEEEFVEGFAGGRHHFEPRTKELGWVELEQCCFKRYPKGIHSEENTVMVMMDNVH